MAYKIVLALLLALMVIPSVGFARHNDGNNDWGVDRDELDDDSVKNFPIPVLFGILYDDITPDFGDPRGDGTREHEGQDLFAPKGTPIVSPTEAIVIRTGTGDSAGKYVYTANPGGETFRYMHLDTIANLDPGDELKAGDYLGTVGDTGNAPDGVYHLHFEVRDEDNDADDPYPRMEEEFTLKQKMASLVKVFKAIRNDDEYADFLVSQFKAPLVEALNKGYVLPEAIKEALEDKGIVSQATALEKLTALIASLPKLLTMELAEGSQGPAVVLLQIYLIYATDGVERDALAASGPTGYFGPVTVGALMAYQKEYRLEQTGSYDTKTQAKMTAENDITLNLGKGL